jgi:hypothetical protein
MALKKTLKLVDNFGEEITFVDAYIRVDTISGGKDEIIVAAGVYKNQGGVKIDTVRSSFTPSLSGDNFVAQAYLNLKTLEQFAGAQDC